MIVQCQVRVHGKFAWTTQITPDDWLNQEDEHAALCQNMGFWNFVIEENSNLFHKLERKFQYLMCFAFLLNQKLVRCFNIFIYIHPHAHWPIICHIFSKKKNYPCHITGVNLPFPLRECICKHIIVDQKA